MTAQKIIWTVSRSGVHQKVSCRLTCVSIVSRYDSRRRERMRNTGELSHVAKLARNTGAALVAIAIGTDSLIKLERTSTIEQALWG